MMFGKLGVLNGFLTCDVSNIQEAGGDITTLKVGKHP
jgi:hypothetical protein